MNGLAGEPCRTYFLRQDVDRKIHTALHEPVEGKKYCEDVQYLLDQLDELEADLDDHSEKEFDAGYTEGFKDGTSQVIDENSAYQKGYQAGLEAAKMNDALKLATQ